MKDHLNICFYLLKETAIYPSSMTISSDEGTPHKASPEPKRALMIYTNGNNILINQYFLIRHDHNVIFNGAKILAYHYY